jgi:glutamate:GABA antiporter
VTLPKATENLRRVVRLPDLVLFNITVVVGVRWLAVSARTGPGSITLWVAAVVLFFIPSALVVGGLSKRYPEEGGLYVWTREAFGPWHGFLCGACYFVSTLFFLPVALLYGLSIAALAFGFSQDKVLMIGLALAILWLVAILNLLGAELGKWNSDMGGIATILVGALLIVAGWFAWRHGGSATPLQNFVPRLDWEKLNFWSQIALGLTGLELGAIMAGEIRDPRRTIPRAAWMSGLAICAFYVGGTLALLVLVPSGQVDIIQGVMQAAQAAGTRLGWVGFPLLIALLILATAAGAFGSWLSGCARLPFVIGIDRYLPPAFARLHPRWRTPYVALLAVAAFTTVAIVIMMAGESLRGGYQILVDLTTVTTLFPFVYIFAAGWKSGWRVSTACGLGVTALALVVVFIPPEGASWLYEVKMVGGCAAVVVAARMNYQYALRRRKNPGASVGY